MVYTSSLRIDENEWNHVSVTINKTNNTVRFTKDNTQEEFNDLDLSSLSNNDSNVFIGHCDTTFSYFKGDIDNVSIYNTAIDKVKLEIKDSTFPILNLKSVSGMVTDLSGFSSTSTSHHIENTENQKEYADSAFLFNGTSSKIVVDNIDYDGYTNKNVTFSTWVNPSMNDFSGVSTNMPILCKDLISGNCEFGLTSDGKIYLKV
jgi:hypothetical protein